MIYIYIYNSSSIKYIYINHPDLEYFIKNNNYLVLNPEHTFYIENNFLKALFNKYGFKLCDTCTHENFAIFLKFERFTNHIDNSILLFNKNADSNISLYLKNIKDRVIRLNKQLEFMSTDIKKYIWPCSMHTVYLFTFGLNKSLLSGILDNSKYKIGKYLYGEQIRCLSFNEILNQDNNIVIILNGGVYNKEVFINKPNILFIE